MDRILKLLHNFSTVVSLDEKHSHIEKQVPGRIDFANVVPSAREFSIVKNGENVRVFISNASDNQKELKLDNATIISTQMLQEISGIFDLEIATLPHAKNYFYLKLRGNEDTRTYLLLLKFDDSYFATIYSPSGHTDFDSDWPIIHAVAEVQLSQEFKTKIGW